MSRARAKAADERARDLVAIAVDELLVEAPLMRAVAARFLTRPLSRAAGATAAAIAADLRTNEDTLYSRIHRAGGASIHVLRHEIALVRLAVMFEDARLPWPIAADLLGVPHTNAVLRLVRRRTLLPPSLWRIRITGAEQLERFRAFLRANAPAWSRASSPRAYGLPLRATRSTGILDTNAA